MTILFVAEFDPVREILRTVWPQRAQTNVMILIGSFIRKLRCRRRVTAVERSDGSAMASQTPRR